MPAWLIQIIIGLVINIIGYVLLAAAQKPKPPELTEMDDPTADASRPVMLAMGSGTIKSPNIIGDWDKTAVKRNIPADGGKK